MSSQKARPTDLYISILAVLRLYYVRQVIPFTLHLSLFRQARLSLMSALPSWVSACAGTVQLFQRDLSCQAAAAYMTRMRTPAFGERLWGTNGR